MTGQLISNYGPNDANLLNFTKLVQSINAARTGFIQVNLTHYDDTVKPEITAGSVVESGGGLIIFNSNEVISGAASNGDIYFKIVPSEDQATIQETSVAPVWRDDYQGYYSPEAGKENQRYIGGCVKNNSSYSDKYLYVNVFNTCLKMYKDRIAYINIAKIVIGDLKMYWYGNLVLANLTASTATHYFQIKKPCILIFDGVKSISQVVFLSIKQNGNYYHYDDGKLNHRNDNYVGLLNDSAHSESHANWFLHPGEYCITRASAVAIQIVCSHVEGISSLTSSDIDKVYA